MKKPILTHSKNKFSHAAEKLLKLSLLLCFLICFSSLPSAGGQSNTITLGKWVNGVWQNDNYRFQNGNVYKGSTVIATGVTEMYKDFGIVTNSTTGAGREEEVLVIMKSGESKHKVYRDNNFNTVYLKQKLSCATVGLDLYGKKVFQGTREILSNCEVLRCENNYTLAHLHDGQIKLFAPSTSNPNNWLTIKQIITIDNISYFLKSDNTVWKLDGDVANPSQIGSDADLLQENDNQLIKIDSQNDYFRWTGSQWRSLTPNYVSVSPDMIEEGFWFFVQAKTNLNSSDIANHRLGLCLMNSGELGVETIPATGNCDRFLWRTKTLPNGKRLLINKAQKEFNPLWLTASGQPTFSTGDGSKDWDLTLPNRTNLGTNAYQIKGFNNKALSYTSGRVSTKTTATNDLEQVWVLQFNQMVKDYFLPRPTTANLNAHYKPSTNNNIQELQWNGSTNALNLLNESAFSQLQSTISQSYGQIQASYNKFLKGDHGVHFFATKTSSDWVIINYYFNINNMMNAVNLPKPNYSGVTTNDLSIMNGRNLVIINKNDLSASVPQQYFSRNFDKFYVSRNRGGAGYRLPFRDAILTSEELTCKTGITNRPLDQSFRRFDHGIHEFGHALQELGRWVDIVKATINRRVEIALAGGGDARTIRDRERNQVCFDCFENSTSPECICFMLQKWFNNSNDSEFYPNSRAANDSKREIMEIIFNNDNTWMPAKDLRENGYLPSGDSSPNIAKGKEATQSSTASWSSVDGAASRAVDGNTMGNWVSNQTNTVTHTRTQTDPWWQLNLGDLYDIKGLKIWRRMDCCLDRLQDFYIMVSSNPIASSSKTGDQVIHGPLRFDNDTDTHLSLPANIKGQYIRIFVDTKGAEFPLSIAEVEVFGSRPTTTNVAKNKPTTQSSTARWSNVDGASTRAVDGNTFGNWASDQTNTVTHTRTQADPWWQVDLGEQYDLTGIRVWRRMDCCMERLQNFYVMASDQPITINSRTGNQVLQGPISFDNTTDTHVSIPANLRGRYVRIFIDSQGEEVPLSLVEVEVLTEN